jgi:hypothetical protein
MDCKEHEIHIDNAEELSEIMGMLGYIPGSDC